MNALFKCCSPHFLIYYNIQKVTKKQEQTAQSCCLYKWSFIFMHSFLEKLFMFHFPKTVYYFSEKPVNKNTYEQSSLKSGTSDQTTLKKNLEVTFFSFFLPSLFNIQGEGCSCNIFVSQQIPKQINYKLTYNTKFGYKTSSLPVQYNNLC